jgi:hypothetical protein
MADSWDDDDFEVSTVFTAPTAAATVASSSTVVDSWEDEVDETEIELNNKKKSVVVEQSATQIEAAKKKAKEAKITRKKALENGRSHGKRKKKRPLKAISDGQEKMAT